MSEPVQRADPGHIPVLFRETLEALRAAEGGSFLDGTFGGGGHSRGILEANPANRLLALDCDPAAEVRARAMEADFGARFRFRRMNFGELASLGESGFDGVLLDLGLSSFQLDEADRGFSFRQDAPADMRLDNARGQTAAEFLEEAPEDELVRAVRDLGEEPRWRAVVRAILGARGSGRLSTTSGIADLVAATVGGGHPRGRSRMHPATRTFQGIRILINRELENLDRALEAGFSLLAAGGRFVVISFHSLEDRAVKRFFREKAGRPVSARDSRTSDERTVEASLPHTKPVRPGEPETNHNPRSRSSRLRVLIRLEETA